MQLKTIKVYGRLETLKDGRTFVKYSYTKDGEKFYRIAFKKTARNYPVTEVGYLLITFDMDLCNNPKKGAQYTKKDGTIGYKNDIIYLDGNISYEVDVKSNNEKASSHNEEINAIFADL